MNNWQKEFLNLQVGDWIIWQDEEIKAEGRVTFVAPGMVGKVLSLHPNTEMQEAVSEMVGEPINKRALVEFENGMRILIDVGEDAETVNFLQIWVAASIRRKGDTKYGMDRMETIERDG